MPVTSFGMEKSNNVGSLDHYCFQIRVQNSGRYSVSAVLIWFSVNINALLGSGVL